MNLAEAPIKSAGETLRLTFPFESFLGQGESLVGASCAAEVWSGSDPSPDDIVDGSATIVATSITQLISGGVEGTIYLVTCTATTDDSQVIQLATYLPVCPLSS